MTNATTTVPDVTNESPTHQHTIETPAGSLLAQWSDRGLRSLIWKTHPSATNAPDSTTLPSECAQLKSQLRQYFNGERITFTVALDPIGTPFQKSVWDALTRIPYGDTRSYSEQARSIGRPDAVRAVAAANGRNPISIIVPCHRVIGSDGSLTGYAGGLHAKRMLLDLESQDRASAP